jgi:hypothetical protein
MKGIVKKDKKLIEEACKENRLEVIIQSQN